MEMTRTKRYLIQTAIFVVLFGVLLTLATMFDLEISHMLAKPYLADGAFYSTNPIGLIVEYIGSFPIFALGVFACLIFMHHIYHLGDKRKYLAIIFVVLIYGLLFYFFSETFKYFVRNNFHPDLEDTYRDAPLAVGCIAGLALLVGTGSIYFYRKVDVEKNKKLLRFAFVILIAALGYFIATVIKSPIGRMRYRAMNMINDFDHYYTPWFEVSTVKTLKELEELKEIYPDAFKSFPSGHTYSAGVSYVLICLPYVCDKLNNKKGKLICYLIPILYTGLVAFYRIRVGAHFFSDVLVGGTLAFIFTEIGRYFLFEKRVFSKNKN